MAKRPSVTNITSGYASTTAINANVNSLAEGFDNTLSLDGSTPNAMGADLDLNSNDLLNGGSASFTSLTVGGSNVLEPTAARVKELYESNSDTNAFTDADHSKLDGVADSANNYSHPNHTGDVTSSGDGATTIANNAVTGAKIADDAVDSEHIADGAIDLAHMSANSVDSDQYVDGSIDTAHIGDDQVTYAKIQNVSSNNVLLGNDDGAGSAVQELTAANVRTIINVEDGATADQTAAEIRTLVESASDSNVFTDADHTKLNGIEASADVTDATNVTAAGALMDSEVTNLAQVKAFDSSDYATAAQGSTADAAMPKAGGTFTGDISFEGATDNDYETTITVTDPTADRTITLPNASGTVLLSDGDGSNLTGVQAASVDIDESTDDDVNYNILFSDTSGSGSIQMTPQQDDDGFTFNPSSNLVATTGTFRAGPGVADSDFLFLGYGANSSTEYVAMGVQTGYASITAGGVGSTSTDLRIRTANSGTEADKVTIKADGKTGIGTTSPSEALDVVGNIAVSGTVDGVDIAARDAVLTSTTTTANAAMPLSGGTFTGDVTILNTDGGSGRAPDFNLKRDSASPAAWDYLGAVRFLGEDGGSNETPYASILGRIVDPTSGSEDGRLEIWQQKAGTGTLTYVFEHDKFKLMNEQPIMWQDHHGTAYDVFVEPATPTADQTITLPNQTGTAMLWQSAWPDDTGTARNHAIGYQALNDLASGGEDNVAYGHQALEANTTGDDNVAIGNYALAYATTVSNNTAVGYAAGFGDTTQYGTFVGAYAGNYNVSSKDYQTAIGYNAMNDCSGDEVTAVGALSMSDGFHYQSVAVGMDALGRSSTANPYYNVAVGAYAGNSVYSGDHNTFLGYNTDVYTNSSSYSVAIGSNADISGNFSVAMGYNASASSIGNSDYCTFVGQSAGYDMDGGDQCTFIGSNAGYNGGTGSGNNSVGVDSLRSLSSGNHNNALGYWSLYDVTSGDYNSSLGAYSGRNVSTGSNNTFLGYNAGYWQDSSTINALTTGSNVTCVGFEAVPSSATATNEITLGDNDISSLRCNVQTISSLSDERDKTAIKDLTYGLDFINDMRPVEFTWNRRDGSLGAKPDMGFIAQDLYETELNHSSSSRTRLVNWENPEKLEADYVRSYPILVKAVQELSAQVTALQARIETLEGN